MNFCWPEQLKTRGYLHHGRGWPGAVQFCAKGAPIDMKSSRDQIRYAVLVVVVIVSAFGRRASAQPVPFYYAGATSFEPTIGVVNSGGILQTQSVVSDDRKYVTVNMNQAVQSHVVSIEPFAFQMPNGLGYVGGAGQTTPPGAGTGTTGAPANRSARQGNQPAGRSAPPDAPAPSHGGTGMFTPAPPPASILDKPGMTLVMPVAAAAR